MVNCYYTWTEVWNAAYSVNIPVSIAVSNSDRVKVIVIVCQYTDALLVKTTISNRLVDNGEKKEIITVTWYYK